MLRHIFVDFNWNTSPQAKMFRGLAGDVLPEKRAQQLENWLWNCAELKDLTPLVEALAHPI